MSVHVFILQLDENEIEKRSSHPERSSAWEKASETDSEEGAFRDTLERHIWQQGLILEAAEETTDTIHCNKALLWAEIGAG